MRLEICGKILDVPPPAQRASAFIFSLRKSGSVLFDKIVEGLSNAACVPNVNLSSWRFVNGLPHDAIPHDLARQIFMRDGYLFSGFRFFPPYLTTKSLEGNQKILLIRDPRDMLVSLYFSDRYSHVVPEKGSVRQELLGHRHRAQALDIDSFVLSDRADELMNDYRQYMRLTDSAWRIYRYEDVIFNKRKWATDIAAHLQMNVSWWQRVCIARHHDARPRTVKNHAHIRQVKPGNHKIVLRPETIALLNDRLADILHFHQAHGHRHLLS